MTRRWVTTTMLLTEKYTEHLDGVLHCYDRLMLTGSLMPLCFAHGITKYLNEQRIRVFDYAQFAQPLAERFRAKVEALAQAQCRTIEYIRKKNFRKEARIDA